MTMHIICRSHTLRPKRLSALRFDPFAICYHHDRYVAIIRMRDTAPPHVRKHSVHEVKRHYTKIPHLAARTPAVSHRSALRCPVRGPAACRVLVRPWRGRATAPVALEAYLPASDSASSQPAESDVAEQSVAAEGSNVDASLLPDSQPAVVGRYTAEIVPADQVPVVPEVAGQVLQFNLEVGDRVTKDELLMGIDSSTYQAQRAQALAALAGSAGPARPAARRRR